MSDTHVRLNSDEQSYQHRLQVETDADQRGEHVVIVGQIVIDYERKREADEQIAGRHCGEVHFDVLLAGVEDRQNILESLQIDSRQMLYRSTTFKSIQKGRLAAALQVLLDEQAGKIKDGEERVACLESEEGSEVNPAALSIA